LHRLYLYNVIFSDWLQILAHSQVQLKLSGHLHDTDTSVYITDSSRCSRETRIQIILISIYM